MGMKVKKEEIYQFWDEALGENWYNDGEGDFDADKVDLDDVYPRWQGQSHPAEPGGLIKSKDIDGDFLAISCTTLFKRWRSQRTNTMFTVIFDVPKEQAATLMEQVKALGGKVTKT
jgi:hypothetical protein